MGRKSLKREKNAVRAERESLLATERTNQEEEIDEKHIFKLNAKSNGLERKRSIWAPAATATNFEDVPVFTICPYCSQKCVTKTHFKRGRKQWSCCCCLPYFLDVFKDVIHSCPKCNKQIAIYNRFHFFKRETTHTNQTAEKSVKNAVNSDMEISSEEVQ